MITGREKLLFLEALALHIWVGLLLKIIPFRWLPRLFSNPKSSVSSSQSAVSSSKKSDLLLIKMAIARAGSVSPWNNMCLVSSLSARCMLRRRKIVSQLYLGVTKGSGGRIIAHAWLIAGELELVSKSGNYQPLKIF